MPNADAAKLPIVKIAAGAVIVFCAVGVGVMTGLIPGVSSKEEAAPVPESAPAVTGNTATEKEARTKTVATEPVKAPAKVAAPVQVAKATPSVCHECGVVESVNPVEVKGESTGAGAVVGGIAGLIVGNQIGQKKGRTLAKIAGAAGGAYAGNEIEKNAKKTTQYEVTVRMDDGTRRTMTQASIDGLAAGSRVKVIDGAIVRN